jgi:hypothetical protein
MLYSQLDAAAASPGNPARLVAGGQPGERHVRVAVYKFRSV